MKGWFVLGMSGVLVLTGVASANGATRYVKPGGAGNCTSWTDACTLTLAVAIAQEGDSIWVKKGTYPPIQLLDGVNVGILGGFAGTESLASQSNPATNQTTIDGLLGTGTSRCASSVGHTSATILRGLRFVNGYDGDDSGGGGLFLEDSGPQIVDCVFENNTAAYVGGAVFARGNCTAQFVNCLFRNNGATTIGGGPYGGGGIFQNLGTLTVTNCLFHDNRAGEGGAIWIGEQVAGVFVNCTFAENEATIRRGGAVYNLASSTFQNCIFWGNIRHDYFHLPTTYPDQIRDYFNRCSVSFSEVKGGWPGAGNFDANPLFVNSTSNDFRILEGSPCEDVGDANSLPADAADLDWDGNTTEQLPRDLNRGPRMKNGALDLGAYETALSQQQGN